MASNSESLDDLAYVRQLSESGARAPLTGGRFMAWWGLCVSAAYVAHHFALHGAFGDNGAIFGIIWLCFAVVAPLGQIVLVKATAPKAGSGSAGNLASRAVWMAGGLAIMSMVVGAIVAAQTGQGVQTFDWIVPVAFAVYACALIVTGLLAREMVAKAAGFGAVVMVGLFTALIQYPDRYLIAAAGVAATVLLPGLILLSREPAAQS